MTDKRKVVLGFYDIAVDAEQKAEQIKRLDRRLNLLHDVVCGDCAENPDADCDMCLFVITMQSLHIDIRSLLKGLERLSDTAANFAEDYFPDEIEEPETEEDGDYEEE